MSVIWHNRRRDSGLEPSPAVLGISLLVTKLQFCHAIARKLQLPDWKRLPPTAGSQEYVPKLVPPAAGLGTR